MPPEISVSPLLIRGLEKIVCSIIESNSLVIESRLLLRSYHILANIVPVPSLR